MIHPITNHFAQELPGSSLRILGHELPVICIRQCGKDAHSVLLELKLPEQTPPKPRPLDQKQAAQIAERLLLNGEFAGFRISSIHSPIHKVPGQEFAASIAFRRVGTRESATVDGLGTSIPAAVVNALRQVTL